MKAAHVAVRAGRRFAEGFAPSISKHGAAVHVARSGHVFWVWRRASTAVHAAWPERVDGRAVVMIDFRVGGAHAEPRARPRRAFPGLPMAPASPSAFNVRVTAHEAHACGARLGEWVACMVRRRDGGYAPTVAPPVTVYAPVGPDPSWVRASGDWISEAAMRAMGTDPARHASRYTYETGWHRVVAGSTSDGGYQ